MSARDVIANILMETDVEQDIEWDYFPQADAILSALISSGYRILGPDEIDAVTVEKCAEVAEEQAEWVPLRSGDMRTAIRALCATHQGDK